MFEGQPCARLTCLRSGSVLFRRSADLPRFFRGEGGTLRGLLCAVAIGLGVRPVRRGHAQPVGIDAKRKAVEGRLEAKEPRRLLADGPRRPAASVRDPTASNRSAPSTTTSTSSRPPSCAISSAAKCPSHFRIEGTGHFLICAEHNNRRYRRSLRGHVSHVPPLLLGPRLQDQRAGVSAGGDRLSRSGRVRALLPQGQARAARRHVGLLHAAHQPDRPVRSGRSGNGRRPAAASRLSGPLFDRRRRFSNSAATAAARRSPHGRRRVRFDGTSRGTLHSTIVHETTHQVAFNTGLHSRIGQTPKWVIEGSGDDVRGSWNPRLRRAPPR